MKRSIPVALSFVEYTCSVLLLNSSSLAQLGSACYNVTGTGRFVAFGAANTPNDGQLSQTFSRLLKNHLTTPDSL